jgi:uncharacterized protein YkwD
MATIRNYMIFVTATVLAASAGVVAGLTAVQQPTPTATTPTTPSTTPTTPTTPVTPPVSTSPGSGTFTNSAGPCPSEKSNPANGFPDPVNAYRQSIGLPQLKATLPNSYADSRINDMLQNNYVGLVNTKGQDISTQLASNGVKFNSAAMLVWKGCLNGDYRTAINDLLQNPTTAASLNYSGWTGFTFEAKFANPSTKQTVDMFVIIFVN